MTEFVSFCVMGGVMLITQLDTPRTAVQAIALIALSCMCCFINRKLWSK